jgi:CPW-WPC domain-containing protein
MVWFISGCGPNLTRPGYKPPEEEKEQSPTQQFEEATHLMLSQMRFHFDYINYRPLSGVKSEISRVISKYPPRMIGKSLELTSLEIDRLIDSIFKSFLAEAKFEPHDIECARDYSEMCPPRWADLGDGETCEGPPGFNDNEECREVKFGSMTALQKSAAAFKCGETRFPCVDECLARDYSRVCPDGWSSIAGSGVCRAPPSYLKPCVRRYDFTDHGVHLKRKFESMCKVNWPCKAKRLGVIQEHQRITS